MKKCPYCGEEILDVAKKCRHCGEWLDKDERKYEEPKAETTNNNTKGNWKKILLIALSIALICTIGWQVSNNIICKVQFDNVVNSGYIGHIIVIQSPKDKPFSNIEQGIKAKLKDAYGNKVRLEAYCGNKAVIYADNDISPGNIVSYLSKLMLIFKKPKTSEDNFVDWVDTEITDKYIRKSEITTMSDGTWTVGLEFTNEGKDKFAELTKEIVGQPLAIFFNDELISAPVIKEPILYGKAQVSGGFNYEEAKRISDIVQACVDLEIIEVKK